VNLMDTPNKVVLDSKDKLRFYLVGRLETSTNSFVSNIALYIIARYLGFQYQPIHSLLCFTTRGEMYHNKESTQGGTLDPSTKVWLAIYSSTRWITKPKQDCHSCESHNNPCKDANLQG
jgi:hypothetical protein